METQALQEDQAQEQLQKDNQELLQKIQVSDVNVSVPKLGPLTTRTLKKTKHSACCVLGPRNSLCGNLAGIQRGGKGERRAHKAQGDWTCAPFHCLPFYGLPRRYSQGKILGPNRFEPRISDVPGREEGTALITELWTGLWGV